MYDLILALKVSLQKSSTFVIDLFLPNIGGYQRVCSTVREEAVYLTMLSAVTPTL